MPVSLKISARTANGTQFLGERVLEGDRLTIGRSKECSLSLDDPEMRLSRVHAELVRGGAGYRLKVASKNAPVLVNGREHAPGSELQVRTGDVLGLDVYDLEIMGTGETREDPEATRVRAAPVRPSQAVRETAKRIEPGPGAVVPIAGPASQVLAGRYQLEAQIGASGTGKIYRAHDRQLAEDVSVKLMAPELLASNQARQRFITETRTAFRLRHPSIVTVRDVQTDGDQLFLVMEPLAGQTLRAVMEERKHSARVWSEAEALAVVRSLAEALGYAHLSAVHRAVNPENVWLGGDGSVKLMGFEVGAGLSANRMNKTGAGSLGYLAPEQLAGAQADHRADQYALGVLFYELLTGRVPAGRIEPLGSVRADVSSGISGAVDKALAVSPAGRFATDALFLAALGAPGQNMAPVEAPVPVATPGSGRGKWLGLGIGAVAIAGVVAFFLLGPDLKSLMPDREAQKKEEEKIALLDDKARKLMTQLEDDRRELKEVVATSNREVERLEGLARAAQSSQARAPIDAALREARNTAGRNAAVEARLREQMEGPDGLPKAEGNLNAAVLAAKRKDRAEATRLLEETVGALTKIRAGSTADLKAARAAQEQRQNEPQAAEAASQGAQVTRGAKMLRVLCEEGDKGADISINGTFKGECPVDILVGAGPMRLRVVKKGGAGGERVFEQDVRMGDEKLKIVQALLSAPRNKSGKSR